MLLRWCANPSLVARPLILNGYLKMVRVPEVLSLHVKQKRRRLLRTYTYYNCVRFNPKCTKRV